MIFHFIKMSYEELDGKSSSPLLLGSVSSLFQVNKYKDF